MTAASRSWPATVLAGLGLGLALYLAALKIFLLPCSGGDCGAILQSRYAELFGVPISLFAAVCWCACLGPRRLRLAAVILLVAGSLFYVGVQRFVLHGFCPWCCAHAVVAAGSIFLLRHPPRFIGMVVIALSLALSGYSLARQQAHRRPAGPHPYAVLATTPTFDWLARPGEGNILVLSFGCPKCLELLEHQRDLDGAASGPSFRLVFRAEDDDYLQLTALFAAAVEARGGDARAFHTVLTQFLQQPDLLLGNPRGAATLFDSLLRPPEATRTAALHRLSRQQAALSAAGIASTPVVLVRDESGALVIEE